MPAAVTVLALLLILAALTIAVIAIVAWARSRAPRPIIIPMYDRPPGIDLLESAALVRRDTRGVQSALVDLAVRRKVRILVEEGPRGSNFTIELLDNAGLSPLETRLVGLLMGVGAGPGARHELQGGGSPTGESPALVRLRAAARRSIRDRGLMRAPVTTGTAAVRRAAQAVLAATVLLSAVAILNEIFTEVLVASVLVAGVVALGLVPRLLTREPIPTSEGARLRDHLLGLKMYLELAETDRFRMLQSPQGADRVTVTATGQPDPESALKLFERLLPFAVLWGLDDRWTREMSPYLPEAPSDWYDGGGDFSSFVVTYAALSMLLSTDDSLDTSVEDGDAVGDDDADGGDGDAGSDAGADWGDDGSSSVSANSGGDSGSFSDTGITSGGFFDGFGSGGGSGWGGGDFGGGGDGGGGDGGGGGGGD